MDTLHHLRYCRPDSPFFDIPLPRADGEKDLLGAREVPPGWLLHENGEWTGLTPADLTLPAQGWKVHVSAVPEDLDEVLDECWSYCLAEGLCFKFIRTRDILVRRNGKYGDRSSSGKFVTIYTQDGEQLEKVLSRLGARLRGRRGPYILSDLRWEDGPLYVRYGGFTAITRRTDARGVEYLIADPDGRLVEDYRGPSFRPPQWVTIPSCLAPALDARRSGRLDDFPYRVSRALHFSNGGGVYRATDTRTQQEVLLREARPLAGLDGRGDDATARLKRELWALETLAGAPGIPTLTDYRRGNEHQFLAREFVEGTPLSTESLRRNPVLHGVTDPVALEQFTSWALDILSQVERAVHAMHARGVVYGDLHPGNVLVGADDHVRLIDFETATAVSEEAAQAIGAVGFTAPPGYTGVDVDLYALGVLRLSVFMPMGATLTWGTAKIDEAIALVMSMFPLGPAFVRDVRRDLGSAPHRGPSLLRAHGSEPEPWVTPTAETWPTVRARLVQGILASAEPGRTDRCFPGDAEQFATPEGGANLAMGAAGVLWALRHAGIDVPAEHVQWLDEASARLTRTSDPVAPGLLDGLTGIARVLDTLGRPDSAAALMRRVDTTPVDDIGVALYGGLSGIGLARLGWRSDADPSAPLTIARQLAAKVDALPEETLRPGLLHGRAGIALFWLRLFEDTADEEFLDRAEAAIRLDLALQDEIVDRTGGAPPSLGTGVAGSLIALLKLVKHRQTTPLRTAVRSHASRLARAFVPGTGLVHGRAGVLLALQRLTTTSDPELSRLASAAIKRHLAELGFQLVVLEGNPVVLGRESLRMSVDLATGSAGLIVALDAVFSDPTPGAS